MTDINKLVNDAISAMQDQGISHFGLRVINTESSRKVYALGDSLPNSHHWNDGISDDDDVLDGTSCVDIESMCMFDGVTDIESDLELLEPYKGLGSQIVLVAGRSSYEGNDPGETVISGAQVAYVF